MPLTQVLAAVDALVRAQIAPGPAPHAARAPGPHLSPGRGRGVRTVRDYLDALARVEIAISGRAELVSRLRLAGRPRLFANLYRQRTTWLTTPPWYRAGAP